MQRCLRVAYPVAVSRCSLVKHRHLHTSVSTSATMPARDVVAIVGTTGAGKTQLAVELALWLEEKSTRLSGSSKYKAGEIVNADSMQVYCGLDVVTNKASIEERQSVPHHLMDFLEPGVDYRVDRFRADALTIISDIHSRGNLPIIVGGTMYFMQHLLFPGNLVSADDQKVNADSPVIPAQSIKDLSFEHQTRLGHLPIELLELLFILQDLPSISTPAQFPPDFPSEKLPRCMRTAEDVAVALHRILQALDPAMATKWHWRDIRKVRRSVEIVLQTGQIHSDIIRDQQSQNLGPQFRTLMFWPYTSQPELDRRLDARVYTMLERGMLAELREMHALARAGAHTDTSKGIFQAIGFKEFAAYVHDESKSRSDETAYQACVEQTQLATRQYARRQIKWIRNKLLPAVRKTSDPCDTGTGVELYLLDTTDTDKWDKSVRQASAHILDAFLYQTPLPNPCTLSTLAENILGAAPADPPIATKVVCDICTNDPLKPVLLDEGEQYRFHKQSRAHRKRVLRSASAGAGQAFQGNEHPEDIP